MCKKLFLLDDAEVERVNGLGDSIENPMPLLFTLTE